MNAETSTSTVVRPESKTRLKILYCTRKSTLLYFGCTIDACIRATKAPQWHDSTTSMANVTRHLRKPTQLSPPELT